MSNNRYHGIDTYAVSFASYKASVLIRTPLFSKNDFEDLQQEFIIAYLHAERDFDSNKGDRRSFIKSVINNASGNIIEKTEASKRWSGGKDLSIFEVIGEDMELIDVLLDKTATAPDDRLDLEFALKDMPEDLRHLLEELKTYTLKEISENTGIHLQTLVSRLKRLRSYLKKLDF